MSGRSLGVVVCLFKAWPSFVSSSRDLLPTDPAEMAYLATIVACLVVRQALFSTGW